MKFIFCMQIKIKVFYKLIVSIWVNVTRHAQSTQNKLACLCNISIKAWVWVDFLPVDKHKRFLQDDSITSGVQNQACPKYWKQPVYNIFAISQWKCEGWSTLPHSSLLFRCNMLRKKWVMQLIFCMQISMKACYKFILRLFDGDGQAISLQYLRKKLGMKLKKIKTSTSWTYFWWK